MEELMRKYRYLVRKGLKKPQSNKVERQIKETREQLEGYKEELEIVEWARAVIKTENRLKDELLCYDCPFYDQRHACFVILGLGALVNTKLVDSRAIMNFMNEIDRELVKALEMFWDKLFIFCEELEEK